MPCGPKTGNAAAIYRRAKCSAMRLRCGSPLLGTCITRHVKQRIRKPFRKTFQPARSGSENSRVVVDAIDLCASSGSKVLFGWQYCKPNDNKFSPRLR
jgi:hypothetical protein